MNCKLVFKLCHFAGGNEMEIPKTFKDFNQEEMNRSLDFIPKRFFLIYLNTECLAD